jgi:hypothetical protein
VFNIFLHVCGPFFVLLLCLLLLEDGEAERTRSPAELQLGPALVEGPS